MRKSYVAAIAMSLTFALSTTFSATPALAQDAAVAKVEIGKPIYSADGRKLGSVYKVTKAGAPQVIINGKLITLPASSVTMSDKRVVTSLTRKEVLDKG